MIRIIKYCPRCGGTVSDKEYKLATQYEYVSPAQYEEFCENCLVEYEALKCRQEEEKRLFWKG